MARSHSAGLVSRRRQPRQASYSKHLVSLLTQRDEHITEIEMMRSRQKKASPFIKKARTLLTRYWARADWQGREEILRTARWLLNVARLEAAKPVCGIAAVKRTKQRGRALAQPT